jgi:hypothetical protein
MKRSFLLGAVAAGGTLFALGAMPRTAGAAVITQWTFETSIPTTSGPIAAEVGTGTGSITTNGTISNPAGNGSAESFSSDNWNTNEHFQFSTATTGSTGIGFTFDLTRSSTGPATFQLAYSTDGNTFTNFGDPISPLTNASGTNPTHSAWSSGTNQPVYTINYDLSGVTALDNAASVTFRIISTADAGAATGTARVDNVIVQTVPEPGSIFLLSSAGGLLALRRRRHCVA